MATGLFELEWGVDKHGYEVVPEVRSGFDGRRERKIIRGRGGPMNGYRPLETDGLWVQLGEMGRSQDGAIKFVERYGLLHQGGDDLEDIQHLAEKLWAVWQNLDAGDRARAALIFSSASLNDPWPWPEMRSGFAWTTNADGAEEFTRVIVPFDLAAALRQQAVDALIENKRFQACRNGCGEWFGVDRVMPQGRTYTVRREFCSDRCRVAFNRKIKSSAVESAAVRSAEETDYA